MNVQSSGIRLNTTSAPALNHSVHNSPLVSDGCIVLTFTGEFIPWDNPHNLINRLVTEAWERIIHGIFLPLLFLISVPCNLLNIVVFFKHGIKERINLCLFFLSLADLIYVAQAFCLYADRIYLELTHQPVRGALIQFMMNNNINMLFGFSWASSWMTTIIACERCFCVVSPLRSQTVLKTKTMWVIILLSFAVLVGGNYVANAKYDIVCVFYPIDNFTDLVIYPSDFFLRNKELVDTMEAVVYGLIIPQFCVVTVTAATIITVIKLRSMTEWREKSALAAATVSSRDVALTRMLVGTSILYIVSFIPGIVQRISMLFIKQLSIGGHYFNTYNLLTVTVMFFTYINCSFNFFIYYYFGSKFRTTLKKMFRRKSALSQVVSTSKET